jgi:predicted amidohydrolase
MKIGLYAYKTAGKRTTTAEQGLKQILGEDGPCLDVLIAPEYTNIPLVNARALSTLDPEVLLIPGTTLTQAGHSGNILNRAYILKAGQGLTQEGEILTRKRLGVEPKLVTADGEPITHYDKISTCAVPGYSDADHAFGDIRPGFAKFTAGTKPCVFDYLGRRMGLEICRDNEMGFRKGHSGNRPVLKETMGQGLDLQIVLSCGLTAKPNAIKRDGYFACVDGGGDKPTANVYGPGAKLTDVIPIGADLVEKNDTLYIYNIPEK